NEIVCERPDDSKQSRVFHGTTRSIVSNMVEDVSEGYVKHLELIVVGYRAQKQGNKLVLNVGLSHPVEFDQPEGINIDVPSNKEVIIKGVSEDAEGILRFANRCKVYVIFNMNRRC